MSHKALVLFLTLFALLTGCQEEGPLNGRWSGELVSQGIVLDIGDIEFGTDYLEIGDDAVRHQQLVYQADADLEQIRITHQTDSAFLAEVRLIDKNYARMTINGVEGYIELRRRG